MTAPAAAQPSPRPLLRLPRTRRIGRTRVAVLLITALVGYLLVGQVRTSGRLTQRLEALSEGDLARILSGLTTEADNLQTQIAALKLERLSLQTSTQRDATATKAAEDQLHALSILAGTVPASGPGVTVDVADPEASVRYDLFIDIIQELRDAGAEAVAVNVHRVGIRSWFSATPDGAVVLDGATLTAPFQIVAIGDPATLDGGLAIPGGALDTLRAQRAVTVSVQRGARVVVPALASAPTLRVARPVVSGG